MLVHRAGLLVCLIIPRTDRSRLQPTKHRSAKHIPSRKKLRRAGRSAKRYYHSLGVLCNQRLICPWPALPDKFVHHSRSWQIDKFQFSEWGASLPWDDACSFQNLSLRLSACVLVTPALSYPPLSWSYLITQHFSVCALGIINNHVFVQSIVKYLCRHDYKLGFKFSGMQVCPAHVWKGHCANYFNFSQPCHWRRSRDWAGTQKYPVLP